MIKSFRDAETGVLTAWGYIESNGDDIARDEEEGFALEPGKWRLVDDEWVPHFDNGPAMNRLRAYRTQILNALAGLLVEAVAEGNTDDAAALMATRQGLKDMPTHPAILAARNDAEFDAACVARYYQLAAALPVYLQNAFVGVV